MQAGIRKNILALAMVGLVTVGAVKITYSPGTCRFFRYYRSFQQAETQVSLVGRVVYSLLLAAQPAPRNS